MVPGQDDDGLAEPVELGLHERHRLVGHAIVIEEVAGDQEEVDAIRQDPIDDAPERVPVALVMCGPLLGIATPVAAEMHVSRVKEAQGSSGRWHAEQYATRARLGELERAEQQPRNAQAAFSRLPGGSRGL